MMEDEIKKEQNPEGEAVDGEKKTEGKEELIEEPAKPLDKMTATELREVALGIPQITGVHAMKKEELLEAIKQAKGISDKKVDKKKVSAGKVLDAKELKRKIIELKSEKESAQSSKDRKITNILRRRINRLKKRSRKAVQV